MCSLFWPGGDVVAKFTYVTQNYNYNAILGFFKKSINSVPDDPFQKNLGSMLSISGYIFCIILKKIDKLLFMILIIELFKKSIQNSLICKNR